MSTERFGKAEFTKKMKKTHTIFMPQMIHYHNDLLQAAFSYGGYRLSIVPECEKYCTDTFSTIGKDYCSCATGIVGSLLTMVESGECDVDRIAFLEPQAGGACRAGNYYNLIIECLRKSGYSQIPVLSLNYHGEEKHSGFKINAKMLFGAVAGVCYSDLLMVLVQQLRPYETKKGSCDAMRQKWIEKLSKDISHGKHIFYRRKIYQEIIQDFLTIEVDRSLLRKKVGIVGEIYIKFSPIGNCHLEDFLQKEECDYRQGGFINYCIYVVYSEMKNMELSRKNKLILKGYQKVVDYLYKVQKEINECLEEGNLSHDADFYALLQMKENVLSDYYNIGDGWLMAAEIIDMIEQGYDKILIVHPFGCLVSHVGGRGVIKALKEKYKGVNITSIEYDYEQSKTLRESRIMLAIGDWR